MARDLQIDTQFNEDIEKAALKASVLFGTFGFTWGDNRVPSYNDIYEHIAEQVDRLLENPDIDITSCGRITVRMANDGESDYAEVYFDLATAYGDEVEE